MLAHKNLTHALVARPAPYDRHVDDRRDRMIDINIRVDENTLPALYSAWEEISNEVGSRLEAPHRYDRQDALTSAARALGAVRAGIAEAMAKLSKRYPKDRRWHSPLGDPDYR
jgi:hypothetical protein